MITLCKLSSREVEVESHRPMMEHSIRQIKMNETDKETAEVMNCLLSMSKMQTNQFSEVQYWQNCDTVNCDNEQIIWKLDADGTVVQQVPVEYKIDKPVTYVVTQSVIKNQDTDLSASNKVVLIQELPQQTHYTDLQFIPSTTFEQRNAVVEPDPSSSKTDSSYSGSIDVEVDDLDHIEGPLQGTSEVATFHESKTKKCRKPVRKKAAPRKTIAKRKKNCPSPSKDVSHAQATDNKKSSRVKDDEFTKLEDNWQQVDDRFKLGCECSLNCFYGLNPEKVFRHHLNIADLTKAEHDMYLMGNILASLQNPEETCRKKERLRMRTTYAFYGKKVCLTAFLYLEHVTLYHMKRLRKHVQSHGVSPRIHGNHGRKPSNTLSLDIYQHATQFVHSFIKRNPVNSVVSSSDTGKLKSTNKNNCYRLPTDCTKRTLHDEYKTYCEKSTPSAKVMQYSTFTNFFKKQFPNVKFRKSDRHERKMDEIDANCDKFRRVKKRSKNKAIQNLETTADMSHVVKTDSAKIESPQYQSPFVIVQSSQVLDCDPPVILQTQNDMCDHYISEIVQ